MNWGGLKKKIHAPRETNSSPPSFKKRFAPMVTTCHSTIVSRVMSINEHVTQLF